MIWLTANEARKLLRGNGKVTISPDLGLSQTYAEISGNLVQFPTGERITLDILKSIARDTGSVYFIKDGEIFKAAIRSGGNFYKLVPVKNGAPTHEINGIRMHRVKDTTPDKSVRLLFKYIRVKQNMRVLDICTGLGYTAQEAARRGGIVTTIEVDENVLELSKVNPWSRDFWEFVRNGQIKLIVGDATKIVKEFKSESFNVIIHDPPRFALAGELYSLEFYKELARISRPGAQLFHYTGNPGERFRRKSVTKGVMERLRRAGWQDVKRITEIQGILAKRKPYA